MVVQADLPPVPLTWLGYAGWTLAGALCALCAIGFLASSILVLVLAAVAAILAARRLRLRAEALGLASGIGVAVICLALVHNGALTCPGSTLVTCEDGCPAPCDGFDLIPWFIVGASLALGGLVAFLVARRRTADPAGAITAR